MNRSEKNYFCNNTIWGAARHIYVSLEIATGLDAWFARPPLSYLSSSQFVCREFNPSFPPLLGHNSKNKVYPSLAERVSVGVRATSVIFSLSIAY